MPSGSPDESEKWPCCRMLTARRAQENELAEVKNTMSQAAAARSQETAVYFRKRNDTQVVLDAVTLIVQRLASDNVTTFRFRQTLFDAAARVSDPKVHR